MFLKKKEVGYDYMDALDEVLTKVDGEKRLIYTGFT